MLDEVYFRKFDMERICIDKVFFVVYDKRYSQENHSFDKELRDRFIEHVKMSRVKKGTKAAEQVLRRENGRYSAWELQLRGARTMRFHVNVIHYLQELHNIVPLNVLHDDNFIPVDSKLNIMDFINALHRFINDAMQLYKDIVKSYWGEELKEVMYKISEIEIPYEIYPASVDDIANNLYASGIAFKKFNSQSGTLYLNTLEGSNNEISVDRAYDKIQKIDDYDIEPEPSIVYINKINSGRNAHKVQLKIYQKTFGLVRIETTLYSIDAKNIFRFNHSDNESIAETLINFIHFVLKENNICPDRYDRSLDDVVRFLAVNFKEPEDLIYILRDCDIFETSRANHNTQKRLVRKGILLKKTDNDNQRQRGIYLVNPVIRDFLRMYKPKGNEHFVKGGLFPDL